MDFKYLKLSTVTIALVLSTSSHAALIERLGGLAYYDDVADLTWLADANYAQTSGYDADGRMTWYEAEEWVTTLEINGLTGWRLPTMVDTGSPGCDFAYSGTDCGYNVDTSSSEMANLFYSVLGNSASRDSSGEPLTDYGLSNTSGFINFQSNIYWTGSEFLDGSLDRWSFYFNSGRQGPNYFGNSYYALAVQSGDVGASVVPVPAAAWLFGSGLIGLIGFVRHKKV